jgi:hypothetical protein
MVPFSGIQLLRTFVDTATAMGSRSSILAPLQWLTAILGSTTIGCAYAKAPGLSWALGISTLVAAGFLLGAYIWFGLKNPDSLRSEKFMLSKMAMEKGYLGDDRAGLVLPRRRRTATEAVDADRTKKLGPGTSTP